jgi:polyadenylate-binding protein
VDEALTVYDEYVKTKGGDGDEATEAKEGEKTEQKA